MEAKLAPWTVGIDNQTPDTQLPNGAVVDAVNGLFDSGAFLSRTQFALASAGTASFVKETSVGVLYVLDGHLIDGAGLDILLLDSTYVSYVELPDSLLIVTPRDMISIDRLGAVTDFLIEQPGWFNLAGGTGDFPVGSFRVGISYLDMAGREGPLSPIFSVDDASAISVSAPPPVSPNITHFRVYAAHSHSEGLYAVGTAPIGGTVLYDKATQQGRLAVTDMTPMVSGKFASLWRSRLLVARGRNLYVSEPMQWHINDPRTGFVQFPDEIRFVVGVEGGVFVGQENTVHFLSGTRPTEWNVVTHVNKPISEAATAASASEFGIKLVEEATSPVAVWLSTTGFVLGLPNGKVVMPQAERLLIPEYPSAAVVVEDRFVTAYIHQR